MNWGASGKGAGAGATKEEESRRSHPVQLGWIHSPGGSFGAGTWRRFGRRPRWAAREEGEPWKLIRNQPIENRAGREWEGWEVLILSLESSHGLGTYVSTTLVMMDWQLRGSE